MMLLHAYTCVWHVGSAMAMQSPSTNSGCEALPLFYMSSDCEADYGYAHMCIYICVCICICMYICIEREIECIHIYIIYVYMHMHMSSLYDPPFV